MIDFDDFEKIELKVAKILEAKVHENADRLLVLQVDLGSEQRQIVAGLAENYSTEELVGKNIVILTNLKPATIRGVESNGMLLAAGSNSDVKFVTVDGEMPPGSRIG